jgi:hypothetical protein
MEYVEGETLADELRRRERLAPAEVVELGMQVCAALEAAHAAGLVHRDVKPQNILRARDGTAKLADFGIARSLDATALTEHGQVVGTAAYLAPEQARGERVTSAADLYALGIVLYEALTGRRPHEGESVPELLLRRERESVVPPAELAPGVPAALEAAVMRCLALRPEYRPSSAAALGRELGHVAQEAAGSDAPTLPADPTRVRPFWARPAGAGARRRRLGIGIVAALTLLVALALPFLVARWPDGEQAGERPTRIADETAVAGTTTTPALGQTQPLANAGSESRAEGPPSCADIERRKERIEEEKRALDAEREATQDEARRAALEERKRVLEEEKQALDEQKNLCG